MNHLPFYSLVEPFPFQRDSALIHKAKSFCQSGVDELAWLAQSSDLNPIHRLWAKVDGALFRYDDETIKTCKNEARFR